MTQKPCYHCEKDPHPLCNKCQTPLYDSPNGAINVEVYWGYESTGKDTDYDVWNLCEKCSQELNKKYPRSCSFCHVTIAEVMARIDAKNPHCYDYGDFEAAFQRNLTSEYHCDSYAKIGDRIACELCYDKLTADFKIPISNQSYRIWSGDPHQSHDQRPRVDRTARSLIIEEGDTGDSLREMYVSYVSYQEMLEILSHAPEIKRLLLSQVSVEIYREKYRDRDFTDQVFITNGEKKRFKIPLTWLQDLGKATQGFDPKKPKIVEGGRKVTFGSLEVSALALLDAATLDD